MSEISAYGVAGRSILCLAGMFLLSVVPGGTARAQGLVTAALHSQTEYGDWSLLCATETTTLPACEIAQVVQSEERGNYLMVRFGLSCIRTLLVCAIQLLLPADADSAEAVLMDIANSGPPLALAVNECSTSRCIVSRRVPYAVAMEIQTAPHVTLSYLDARARHHGVALSLAGFPAALQRMVDLNAPTANTNDER